MESKIFTEKKYSLNEGVKDIFKAKDDEIDDLKRRVIEQRDQLQMYPLEGQKTDIAALNKVCDKSESSSLHFRLLGIDG